MMQKLMADRANSHESEVGPDRGVVTQQDAADAILWAAIAIDSWGQQGSIPAASFKFVMQMLMAIREYVLPLPPTGSESSDDLLVRDLKETVDAIRKGRDMPAMADQNANRRGVSTPRMDQYDAYIVHASEDIGLATELAESLKARGFMVWFNSFTPGLRLRRQMEEGLMTSTLEW
jgi:hypothetical protein